jgi:hypothetical protein
MKIATLVGALMLATVAPFVRGGDVPDRPRPALR